MFTLKSNPFYGAYEDAETMLPDLAQLNASIEASYSQMYKDWEKAFGKPFKEWWDKTLQNTVVPWFEKIISMLGLDQTPEQKKGSAAVVDLSMILMSSDRDKAILKAFNKKDASVVNVPGYRAQQGAIAGHADWGSWFGGVVENTGRGAQAAWTLYGQVASYTQEDINRISNPQQRAATQDVVNRIKKMREKLDKVGLAHFLENDTGESIDKYLLRAMQVGVYGKAADWEANFDSYINQILRLGLGGKTDDKIVALLEQIAANTEIKEAIKNNASFWEIIELQYGPTVANDWREKLTNR